MKTYFRTFLRFSRNGKIILGYTLVKGLTLALMGLIYNLFLLSLHYSPAMIGILDAMPPVTVLLVSVPLGMLADRVGRKPLLIVCSLLNPLCYLGLALYTSPPLQIAFGLVNGVVSSFYWVAYPAIIMQSSTDEDRQHLFSANSMLLLGIGSIGYLIGGGITVLVAGVLHLNPDATEPLRWGMFAIVAIGVVGATPLFWLNESRITREQRVIRTYDVGLFVRLLGPDALMSMGAGAVLAFNQLYFALNFRLSAGSVGGFLALAGLVGSLGAVASPALARRLGTARAAIALQFASAPLIAALAIAPGIAVAVVVYVVWAFTRSAGDPTYTGFAMAQVSDDQRSTLSGLYSVTWAVGFGFGPIVTGWLRGGTHGFTAPFLIASACYAIAALVLYTFFGKSSARRSVPEGTQVERSVAR